MTADDICYRNAVARDGVAMWRLRRQHGARGPSPFFFMAVVQRLSESCLIAERGDELIGYVIARPCESGKGVSVLDVTVERSKESIAVVNELLERLVRLPAHAGASFVDAEPGCDPVVRRMLAALGAIPLAKCKRPEHCNTLVRGAAM